MIADGKFQGNINNKASICSHYQDKSLSAGLLFEVEWAYE